MKNKTRWKKRVFALAMAASLSVAGVMAGSAVPAWAVPASGISVADNIVVRESAVSGAQIGGLSEGQAVSIVGETTGSDGNTWYQISYTVDGEERSGWVRGDLLETSEESLDETSEESPDETSGESSDEESGADETGAEASESVSLEFSTQNGSITLTDIPEDELSLVSGRFVETSLAFAEGTITALQLSEPDELVADDAAIVDFYYVYGYNEIGETGWYVYNADDGTIQKNLLNMQYSVTEPEADETETESDFSSDSLTKTAVCVLAVVILLLLALTIIFSVRYRRLRRILEEELEEDGGATRKKTAEDSKRESASGERDRVKTKKKSENPEPVKVRKGAAQPAAERIDDRRQTENTKISPVPEKSEESGRVVRDHAGETAGKPGEKGFSAKKNKKKNTPVQEEPVSEPMEEIGGIDVMDLDSMDDLDFEALLNRYIEEDMASEKDKTAGEQNKTAEERDKTAEEKDKTAEEMGKTAEESAGIQEEPDSIDLNNLKLPVDEPEYYDDDDDDLEFL